MRVDLGFIGFGHVGRRFARLLEERREQMRRAHDLDWRIVGVVTRRHGSRIDADGLDPAVLEARLSAGARLGSDGDAGDLVHGLSQSDAPLRVMVETTTLDVASGRPAIDHVEAALDAGCHVITANKGPVAFAYHRLSALARDRGVSFLFEGAVMDGIPVFNLVRETMPLVTIERFRGVVNSTTNHILSALERGEAFEDALARMQAEGIAEADPSLDVDGWDAAAKAAALANVLLDARITPHDVRRTGLTLAIADRVRAARAAGRRVRLVASARRGEPPVVGPAELEGSDILATLEGTGNALVLTTDLLGDVVIAQPSGDLTATAYALLSDLVAILLA